MGEQRVNVLYLQKPAFYSIIGCKRLAGPIGGPDWIEISKTLRRRFVKNPLKKIFKKPDLKTQLENELEKIRRKLYKGLGVIHDKFDKEVAALKRKGKKIDVEKELKLMTKRGDRILSEMNKRANSVMAGVKKDYKLAIANVRKKL